MTISCIIQIIHNQQLEYNTNTFIFKISISIQPHSYLTEGASAAIIVVPESTREVDDGNVLETVEVDLALPPPVFFTMSSTTFLNFLSLAITSS